MIGRKQTPQKGSTSVAGYLAALPEDRRRELKAVLDLVRRHVPDGYRETLTSGMIVFEVPLARYADTYNGRPLWYVALAAQKKYLSLYLMCAYSRPDLARKLRDGFKTAGRRLDMGKSCIRFQRADDLALEAIAEVVGSTSVDSFVALAEAARRPGKARSSARS